MSTYFGLLLKVLHIIRVWQRLRVRKFLVLSCVHVDPWKELDTAVVAVKSVFVIAFNLIFFHLLMELLLAGMKRLSEERNLCVPFTRI